MPYRAEGSINTTDNTEKTARTVSSAAKDAHRSMLAPMQSIWSLNLYNELFILSRFTSVSYLSKISHSCKFREVNAQELHPPADCRKLPLDEFLSLGLKDDIPGISGHEITYSSFVVDDSL